MPGPLTAPVTPWWQRIGPWAEDEQRQDVARGLTPPPAPPPFDPTSLQPMPAHERPTFAIHDLVTAAHPRQPEPSWWEHVARSPTVQGAWASLPALDLVGPIGMAKVPRAPRAATPRGYLRVGGMPMARWPEGPLPESVRALGPRQRVPIVWSAETSNSQLPARFWQLPEVGVTEMRSLLDDVAAATGKQQPQVSLLKDRPPAAGGVDPRTLRARRHVPPKKPGNSGLARERRIERARSAFEQLAPQIMRGDPEAARQLAEQAGTLGLHDIREALTAGTPYRRTPSIVDWEYVAELERAAGLDRNPIVAPPGAPATMTSQRTRPTAWEGTPSWDHVNYLEGLLRERERLLAEGGPLAYTEPPRIAELTRRVAEAKRRWYEAERLGLPRWGSPPKQE